MSLRVAVIGAGKMGKLHARVLSEMDRTRLVCVVDTNARVAEEVADRIGIIDHGNVVFCGSLAEMRTQVGGVENLEKMFLHLTGAGARKG